RIHTPNKVSLRPYSFARRRTRAAFRGLAVRRHAFRTILVGLIALVLVACGESGTDRRFANEGLPTDSAGATTPPGQQLAPRAPTPSQPAMSAEAMLTTPGPASTVYAVQGGTLWAIGIPSGSSSAVAPLEKLQVSDIAQANDGARVALLVSDGTGFRIQAF